MALDQAIADALISELETERVATAEAEAAAIAEAKSGIADCDKKLDLLLDLRLSEQVGESEYLTKKQALVTRKVELRAKIDGLESNRRNRFEPAIQFVLAAKQATNLLSEGNREKNRDFLKNIGSNFQVADKTLSVTFKTPWQFVAEWNSSVARERADNQFFLTEATWRRGGDSNPR